MVSGYCEVTTENIDKLLAEYQVLLCRLRNSRRKAKQIAVMEMYMALRAADGVFIANGPLGDVMGTLCFFVRKEKLDMLGNILPTIGYCDRFYLLDFFGCLDNESDIVTINRLTWKRRPFGIQQFYRQDPELYQQQSVHNRPFKLMGEDGKERNVVGYRGDGSDLGRRALPMEDCRCLVNLIAPSLTERILDPFAGAGGILFAAKIAKPSMYVISADMDPILRPGLEAYADEHFVCDSAGANFGRFFDAVVTEFPFDRKVTAKVLDVILNVNRFLTDTGRISVMCSTYQVEDVREKLGDLGYKFYLDHTLERKGTEVIILAAMRKGAFFCGLEELSQRIITIY